MNFKLKLRAELEHIRFTDSRKAILRRHLAQAATKRSSVTLSQRVSAFWNGYTEIPVSVLACAACLMALSFGAVCTHVFAVDETSAALLILTSAEVLDAAMAKGVVVL